MPNDYFQFKQFRIEQGDCGMKVSTDACIQGAWTPIRPTDQRIVDVGAGTGLLSLMIAQRSPLATIDAVELDAAAAFQAQQNVASSLFHDRIQVMQADARSWQPQEQYQLVVCNPPFFRNSLTGPDAARNQARHDTTLQPQELLLCLERLLLPAGRACILLPLLEGQSFALLAAKSGWYCNHQLLVKDREQAPVKRLIAVYERDPGTCLTETLCIKKGDGSYSDDFIRLMAPFYLHL